MILVFPLKSNIIWAVTQYYQELYSSKIRDRKINSILPETFEEGDLGDALIYFVIESETIARAGIRMWLA